MTTTDTERTVPAKVTSVALVKTALQHAIRRNDVAGARYWAAALVEGLAPGTLTALFMEIAVEDVGPLYPAALMCALAARKEYFVLRQSFSGVDALRLIRDNTRFRWIVDETAKYLSAAPKNRVCEHICIGVVAPALEAIETAGKKQYIGATLRQEFKTALHTANQTECFAVLVKIATSGVLPIALQELKLLANELHPVPECKAEWTAINACVTAANAAQSAESVQLLPYLIYGIYAFTHTQKIRLSPYPTFTPQPHLLVLEPALEDIYAELRDAQRPLRTLPEFGFRSTKQYVKREHWAMAPRAQLADPFFKLACTTGATALDKHIGESPCKKCKVTPAR